MALTILYRRPDRPHDRGMTMIAGQMELTAIIDQLEKRGFVIDKITARSFASAGQRPEPEFAT
jgi:hypothetical protein